MTSMLDLQIIAIQDAASEAWDEIHKNEKGADYYPCKLCGATMFLCIDYTHEPTCPVVQIEAAIDRYGKALEAAEQKVIRQWETLMAEGKLQDNLDFAKHYDGVPLDRKQDRFVWGSLTVAAFCLLVAIVTIDKWWQVLIGVSR